jgi:hypothetical protein
MFIDIVNHNTFLLIVLDCGKRIHGAQNDKNTEGGKKGTQLPSVDG